MLKQLLLGVFVAVFSLLTCWQDASAADRPNLIFLLTDDQRWDALGCMGNPVIKTPNIDRLAEEGVVFENAFATTAICATSRASFITGQYARRHGIVDFRAVLTPEAFSQTFPALLRANGYQTAFIGKWGVGNQLPADQYDYWKGFSGQGKYFVDGRPHMTKHLEDQTLEFLDTCSPEKPFCLQVSFKAAHCQDGPGWQFQHAPKYAEYYEDDTIVPAETANDEHYQKLPKQLQGGESRVRWHRRFDGDEMVQKNIKDYYRLLTGVDDFVGAMVAKLQEKKLADNTVILFTSDHGFFLGEHGLSGKWLMYEESIRIPMIVFDPRLPKNKRGQRREEMVLNIDVAPTLLDLAGIEPSSVMQGQSMKGLVEGNQSSGWRTEFLYEHLFPHATIPQSEGVREDRWKYVFYPKSEPKLEQLFDLQQDPHEVNNLADDPKHTDKLKAMQAELDQMRTSLQ
ncbi:sulfatase family protein [Bremerella sp. P1]|uniref:sulfatase family protein n=1 Tax=Bremerella sp. P1 TaxID=3026424 RepID=UPI0023678097|nr:sulfatase [Bremerella sp. P1]WDI42959.1 sulfatase [Bremerella sp. P1]